MATSATGFDDAGRSEGLRIWRIENFAPVPLDEKDHGKFHRGDSYVILRTYELGDRFKWNIHFWLGRDTTADEAGAAAILSVELDDSLGGAPVQYREVDGHESQLFLSYFPSGVRYLPGGINSGFTHVDPNEPNAPKNLYRVKGKRNVRVDQVLASVESINTGDSYILDIGNIIYVYHGRNSKKTERLKAVSAANQIRDQDHAGRATVKVLDEFSDESEMLEFFEELGSGSPDTVREETLGDDEAYELDRENKVALYAVSDSSGELQIEKVAEKPLSRSMLKSEDCFILDTLTSGIYAWIGRNSTRQEKEAAMKKSEDFISRQNYPKWTRITRVVEGGEPSTFKEYFTNWTETGTMSRTCGTERHFSVGVVTNDMDESKLKQLIKSGGTALGFSPDNGDGTAEVFRIEDFNLAPVEEDKFGMFFGGDSYVIKYTTTGNRCIIYYWLGRKSSQEERASAAIQAVIMDSEMDGAATIIRVVQGFEPNHFNKIFKGRMIVFSGGHASGFKSAKDNDTYDTVGTRLFRIRGTSPEDVRAVQVPETALSLNSDDVFLLETPEHIYLWFGKGSNSSERDMARSLPMLLSFEVEVEEVKEGEEPEEFFHALGGRMDYPSTADDAPTTYPRLFHFPSNEEVIDFNKEDLESDEVFVLRYGKEVYIWMGKETSEAERDSAKKHYQILDRFHNLPPTYHKLCIICGHRMIGSNDKTPSRLRG